MQIRTQQYLGALVSALVIVAIGVTLFESIQRMNQAVSRSDFAASINAEGISGLRLVTVEYIVFRNERSKLQWQQRQESLSRLLAKDIFEDPNERSILEEIRHQNRSLKETFSALVALDHEPPRSNQEIALSEEVEKRLVTQLMLISQDSVADAARLGRITTERIVESQRRTSWLLVVLVALVGVVIAANFTTSLRRILTPVRRLKQGVDAFAKGDLSFRTKITTNNELGTLSRAFDQMAARLAETMAALEHKTALLQETNKELESFSYSVSHDLRSPLRGIDGWGLALIEDYGDQLDATAHTYVERIRFDTQRMGRLIDDLLQLARVTRAEIKHEQVSLSEVAESIAQRFEKTQEERHIAFQIQPGLVTQGDSRLLEIVLTNLIDNAYKFSNQRHEAQIEFGETIAEEPDTGIRRKVYFVRDNGVGFDMAHAQRLFGAFQRMHKASEFPGTGIGLATVQRIVHRHGGKIWAMSTLDQGATFYFSLSPANPLPSGAQRFPGDGNKEAS